MPPEEYDRMRAAEDHHWWYQVLRWQVVRVLETELPEGATILDAGCGTGGTLSLLGKWQAIGLDTAEEALSHCHSRGLSGSAVLGSVNALPFADASFDAVLCLDVLSHAWVDEALAMKELARVLRPGGLLLLNLPAFDWLRGEHDAMVCGARRYTCFQVRRLLQAHSIEPQMVHYWNAWLLLPLLLRRRRLQRRREGQGSDLMPLPSWLSCILAMLGRWDARMTRVLRLPFGTSVFATCRKLVTQGNPLCH